MIIATACRVHNNNDNPCRDEQIHSPRRYWAILLSCMWRKLDLLVAVGGTVQFIIMLIGIPQMRAIDWIARGELAVQEFASEGIDSPSASNINTRVTLWVTKEYPCVILTFLLLGTVVALLLCRLLKFFALNSVSFLQCSGLSMLLHVRCIFSYL